MKYVYVFAMYQGISHMDLQMCYYAVGLALLSHLYHNLA